VSTNEHSEPERSKAAGTQTSVGVSTGRHKVLSSANQKEHEQKRKTGVNCEKKKQGRWKLVELISFGAKQRQKEKDVRHQRRTASNRCTPALAEPGHIAALDEPGHTADSA
jgi:hypothetical protein